MLKLITRSLSTCCGVCAPVFAQPPCSMLIKRTLVGDRLLRLDIRAEQRQMYLQKLKSAALTPEKYTAKLNEQMLEQRSSLFWADLNILMALAQSTTDAQLAQAMFRRLRSQSTDLTENQCLQIGRNAMRMFHVLRLPENALEFYRDPSLVRFFAGNHNAVIILLDLLYDSGLFHQVLEVYQTQKSRTPTWRPAVGDFLYAASCSRIGSNEALENLHKVISESARLGPVGDRELCLAAILAIKLKRHDMAEHFVHLSPRRDVSGSVIAVRIINSLEKSDYENVMALLSLAAQLKMSVPSDVLHRTTALITTLKASTDETSLKYAANLDAQMKELANSKLLSLQTMDDRLFRPVNRNWAQHYRYHQSAMNNSDEVQGELQFAPQRSTHRREELRQSNFNSISKPPSDRQQITYNNVVRATSHPSERKRYQPRAIDMNHQAGASPQSSSSFPASQTATNPNPVPSQSSGQQHQQRSHYDTQSQDQHRPPSGWIPPQGSYPVYQSWNSAPQGPYAWPVPGPSPFGGHPGWPVSPHGPFAGPSGWVNVPQGLFVGQPGWSTSPNAFCGNQYGAAMPQQSGSRPTSGATSYSNTQQTRVRGSQDYKNVDSAINQGGNIQSNFQPGARMRRRRRRRSAQTTEGILSGQEQITDQQAQSGSSSNGESK